MQAYSIVLQMPGNKADAVPCERLRNLHDLSDPDLPSIELGVFHGIVHNCGGTVIDFEKRRILIQVDGTDHVRPDAGFFADKADNGSFVDLVQTAEVDQKALGFYCLELAVGFSGCFSRGFSRGDSGGFPVVLPAGLFLACTGTADFLAPISILMSPVFW